MDNSKTEKSTKMHINYNKLVTDYNTEKGATRGLSPLANCLTKADLARDMVEAGIHISVRSALNRIHSHQRGDTKSVDFETLEFLVKKFNKTPNDILTT